MNGTGISLFFMGLILAAGQPSATSASEVAASPDEPLLFADEFNSGELDRTKWNVIGPDFWVNNEQQTYIDSPDTIRFLAEGEVEGADGGVLVLQPRYHKDFPTPDGRKSDFVSGRIDTRGKFDFAYGRVTARIKLPDAVGVWPAFWALGNGSWPNTGEIDIMEYVGETDWTGVALHGEGYSGETPLVNKYFFPPETDATQWHEYSAEWTPDEVLFKVDGRLTYRATRVMADHYGTWSFDNPKHLILNFALGGAYPYKTNGIEEPYNRLPAVTVDRIKQGDITMYVDWVRVYGTDEK